MTPGAGVLPRYSIIAAKAAGMRQSSAVSANLSGPLTIHSSAA